MQHNYIITGYCFRLRPISLNDVDFILELRTNPNLNKYINYTSKNIQIQIAWLQEYFKRNNDYYFVVENIKNNEKVGLIAVYNIDYTNLVAEWGRWVIKPNSLATIESVLLMYKFAFNILNLNQVYSKTCASNYKVVSFHDSIKFSKKQILKDNIIVNNHLTYFIQHTTEKSSAELVINRLSNLAKNICKKL